MCEAALIAYCKQRGLVKARPDHISGQLTHMIFHAKSKGIRQATSIAGHDVNQPADDESTDDHGTEDDFHNELEAPNRRSSRLMEKMAAHGSLREHVIRHDTIRGAPAKDTSIA
jgi:hypothetical protein